MTTKPDQKGYSLIEIVIYLAILISLVYVIITLVVTIVHTRERLNAAQAISNSAYSSMDRMTREIRGAIGVNASSSVLDTNPGILSLTTDASGTQQVLEFRLISGVLHLKKDGVDIGPLTSSSTNITSLIFRRTLVTGAEGVKIEMTIESGSGTAYRNENFYASATIR